MIELRTFFENAGLKVIDARKKTGFLWVIGEREEIDSVVKEAIEMYKVSGEYGSGKTSGFQQGWFTKSKK